MYDDLVKEALKKLLENGIFIIVLVYFGYDMMNRQDEMIKANELKAAQGQKVMVETIQKIAKQRDEYIQDVLDCYQSRIRENDK